MLFLLTFVLMLPKAYQEIPDSNIYRVPAIQYENIGTVAEIGHDHSLPNFCTHNHLSSIFNSVYILCSWYRDHFLPLQLKEWATRILLHTSFFSFVDGSS
jgi:hypothetical protein